MNPELQRMLWLEATPQRLWLIPAALLGTAFVVGQYASLLLAPLAMFGFLVLTLAWGARAAANAVLDETRERTWDIQRMSALAPWPMTWGKLLGATLMPWYAGALCLAVYFAYPPREPLEETVVRALLVALTALLVQAVALIAALVGVHHQQRRRARLHLVIVLALLFGLLLPELTALLARELSAPNLAAGTVTWYGRSYPAPLMSVALVGAFAAWAVVGAWRAMCIELAVRTLPWLWLAFIAFVAVLVCGFVPAPASTPLAARWCSAGALVAIVLAYIAGFAFARDPVQYRRIVQALRARRYRRALEDVPLWLSSAACALALALLALGLGPDRALSNERIDNLGAVALVLALFMVRDLALLSAFSFRQRSRRAEIVALAAIALLNRIAPALVAALGLPQLAALIRPPLYDAPALGVAVALVQALLATACAVLMWRRAMRPVSPSGDRRS